jgi:hypothetical protein
MLRRPKYSKNEVLAPKEEEKFLTVPLSNIFSIKPASA